MWKHRSLIAKCPYEIKDNKYKKDKKVEKADRRKSKKYMEEALKGIVTPKRGAELGNLKILTLNYGLFF